MNIDRIIDAYEQKAESERNARLLEIRAESVRVKGNADKLKQAIYEVIVPAISPLSSRLKERGYKAEVTIKKKQVQEHGAFVEIEIDLSLNVSSTKNVASGSFGYAGDEKTATFKAQYCAQPKGHQLIGVFGYHELTEALVLSHAEQFLRDVFGA